jgi:hypothetical protein
MALVSALLLPGCKDRDQRLTEQGNTLIARIDSFQKATHRLPESLRDLGLEEKMEGPLYYQKVSAEHYTLGTRSRPRGARRRLRPVPTRFGSP